MRLRPVEPTEIAPLPGSYDQKVSELGLVKDAEGTLLIRAQGCTCYDDPPGSGEFDPLVPQRHLRLRMVEDGGLIHLDAYAARKLRGVINRYLDEAEGRFDRIFLGLLIGFGVSLLIVLALTGWPV